MTLHLSIPYLRTLGLPSQAKRVHSRSCAGLFRLKLRGMEVLIGRELASFLLEKHVAMDEAVQPSEACCLTLPTKAVGVDPHPEPPAKFLEPTTAARLAAEVKRRSRPSSERSEEPSETPSSQRKRQRKRKKRLRARQPKRNRNRHRARVRMVVATMANSETFGWQVAAEVHRRGLDQAKRKACVCDGQAYNWSIYEMHLLPLEFIAVLDVVHLMAYLYDGAETMLQLRAAQLSQDDRWSQNWARPWPHRAVGTHRLAQAA